MLMSLRPIRRRQKVLTGRHAEQTKFANVVGRRKTAGVDLDGPRGVNWLRIAVTWTSATGSPNSSSTRPRDHRAARQREIDLLHDLLVGDLHRLPDFARVV